MPLLRVSRLQEKPQAINFIKKAPFWADNWPRSQALFKHWLKQERDWHIGADKDNWQWLAALEALAFDSEIFGYQMGRLNLLMHSAKWPEAAEIKRGVKFLEGLKAAARKKGMEFLLARVNVRDFLSAQALEQAGFKLSDISVEWMLTLDRLPPLAPVQDVAICPWREANRKPLLKLAASAFSNLDAYADRFTLDTRLRPNSGALYKKWLENSLNGQQADQVLALKHEGQCRGFISLRLPDILKDRSQAKLPGSDCAFIVLNALAPLLRGRGLYNVMLLHALHWLRDQGAYLARIRTKVSQSAVISAWSGLGARQVWSDMSFHWWQD